MFPSPESTVKSPAPAPVSGEPEKVSEAPVRKKKEVAADVEGAGLF